MLLIISIIGMTIALMVFSILVWRSQRYPVAWACSSYHAVPESPSSTSDTQMPRRHPNSPPPPQLPPGGRQWLKLILAIGLTVAVMMGGSVALIDRFTKLQSQWQQEQQATLAIAQQWYEQGVYDVCLASIDGVETNPFSNAVLDAQRRALQRRCQEGMDQSKLQQAQVLAFTDGRYRDAIHLLQEIEGPALQPEAAQLIAICSERILHIAESYFWDASGRLDDAMNVARAITADNPWHDRATAKMEQWLTQWAMQENYYQAAQVALTTDRLNEARQQAEQVTHPFWRTQLQPIQEQIFARQMELETIVQQARIALEQAHTRKAISLANSLPDTSPWIEAKTELIQQAKKMQQQSTSFWQIIVLIVGLLIGLRCMMR